METEDQKLLEKLTDAINHVYEKPTKIYVRYFFLGLFYGIGATVGAALLLAILGLLVKLFGGMPLIGDWLRAIFDAIPNR